MQVEYGDLKEIQMQDDEIESIVTAIKNMPDNGIMIEWGSGGSTVHWLLNMRKNQRLITIEHNPEWYKKVNYTIINYYPELKDRHTMHLYEPIHNLLEIIPDSFYKHWYGHVNEEHPVGLTHYLNPINDDDWKADIFLVDGIARAVTALVIRHKSTQENPTIFMHDFKGREHWYGWVLQFFSKWKKAGTTLIRLWK